MALSLRSPHQIREISAIKGSLASFLYLNSPRLSKSICEIIQKLRNGRSVEFNHCCRVFKYFSEICFSRKKNSILISMSNVRTNLFALSVMNFIQIYGGSRLVLDSNMHSRSLSKIIRLKGGSRGASVRERWESAGFSLQPDFGPEAHPDVPLEHRLGDAAEYGDLDALRRLIQVDITI